MPDDCVTKCDQNPSWVPGRCRLTRSRRSDSAQLAGRGPSREPTGRSWMNTTMPTSATTDRDAALRKAVVQPDWWSISANGMADSIWPSCPMLPIHWES